MLKQLYKKSKNGKLQLWFIEVSDGKYRTNEGFVDGIITCSAWTQCFGKNIGRSNETNDFEQAYKEAEALYKKQLERGYVDDISKVNSVIDVRPMLAQKYNEYVDYVMTLDEVALQPKYDGIRCAGLPKGPTSRQNKPIVAVPHIAEEIQDLLELLPCGAIIDGELYNHELKDDFNEIISIVRKSVLKPSDIQKSKDTIQYHIYDVAMRGSFKDRFDVLREIFRLNDFNYLKLAPTTFLSPKLPGFKHCLDEMYKQYLNAGYEGQMIRNAASPYEHYRSKYLLKRKEFVDEEFEIIDIEEGKGNRSGMAGAIVFNGFSSGIKGTEDYFRSLLFNKYEYIGKMATVRYQALTPKKADGTGGVPRFPVVVAIRDYE